jgi:hypothetical protein
VQFNAAELRAFLFANCEYSSIKVDVDYLFHDDLNQPEADVVILCLEVLCPSCGK